MSDVTGLSIAVVKNVITQFELPEILNRIILDVETFNLSEVNLICSWATHRSVATAFMLMLLVYHNAVLVAPSKRVEKDAVTCLRKVL